MTLRDITETYVNFYFGGTKAYIDQSWYCGRGTGVHNASNEIFNCEYEYTQYRTVLRKDIIGVLLLILVGPYVQVGDTFLFVIVWSCLSCLILLLFSLLNSVFFTIILLCIDLWQCCMNQMNLK